MKVRALRWEDFEPLVQNYFDLYEEVRENPDVGISLFPARPTLAEEAEWFAGVFARSQRGEGVVVVAEEGGRAIGLCSILPAAREREGQHIGVLGILVGRAWRGRGAGRAMMQKAIEEARGKFELVELSVFASNEHASALYRSLGFTKWGTLPKGIRRGGKYTDLDRMVLDLSADPPARAEAKGGRRNGRTTR